jgi:signal transduction histidine kinase/streptogramin lyase
LAGGPIRALDPARPLSTCAHRVWNTENGLLQDTATALLESRDGFLWIGTEEGLVRFDGARFVPFSRANAPTFTNTGVRCLADTADGALWIGTSQPGLFRLQGGAFTRLGPEQGLPEGPIRRLFRDREGTLWAAPEEGPLLRLEGSRFQAVPCDAAHLRIRALAQGPDGTLWAGGADSGLWRLHEGRLVLSALTPGGISALEVTSDGQVWVGTRTGGLQAFHQGRLETPAWARSLPAAAILTLLADREGSLWIGTDRAGLFRHTPDGRLEQPPGGAVSPWAVLSLLEDSSGVLWVGTENRGLHLISEVPFRPVPGPGGDPQAPIRMVCEDAGGTVWCLLGDHRLATLQGGRLVGAPAGPLLDRSGASALWPRRAGGLWVGTPEGDLLLLEGGRTRRLAPALGDAVLALYEDPRGALWVSTVRQGLRRLEPDGGAELVFPAEQGVVAMAGGGREPLYLGSRSRGLGLMEKDRIQWLGGAEGLDSASVLSLRLDGTGDLWVGTQDGLRLYRDGAFQHFPALPEPLRMAIHAILEDTDGRLWVTTRQGVVRVDKTALLATLDQPGAIPLVSFDQRDGLPSRELNQGPQPAAWQTREGDLCLPTGRGLAVLDARLRTPAAPRLQVHLEQVLSDERALSLASGLTLSPGVHRLEIHYTATCLSAGERIRFRYRLVGFDQTWNEVGPRRFAVYSNLPPGRYRFLLEAWNPEDDAPPRQTGVDLMLEPYLYQRPVFWALCGLVVLAFAGWLHRLRLQQLEARSAVLAERNRMAREIHDHLAQGFTGVLLQMEAAEALLGRLQGDPKPVLTRLEHARQLASDSLQEARRSVMALRPRKPEGTDLLGAIRLLADRLLVGTDIRVELAQSGRPRSLGESMEEELLRMAQETLTNALRHGRARAIQVLLAWEGRRVRLSVQDDGCGFDPKAQSAGYGMHSIRETLRRLRGRLDVESRPGAGARITITLPIRRWRP